MPQKTDSSNPSDWLWFAESDLEGIRHLSERELAHAMCLSKLSEVVEKTLKAELIRLGWRLEKTHDLQQLASILKSYNSDLFDQIQPLCADLAEAYFADRYPGFDLDPPDWPDLREKITAATQLLQAVKKRIPAPKTQSDERQSEV